MSEIIDLVESSPIEEEVEPEIEYYETEAETETDTYEPRIISDYCCSSPVYGDFSCSNCGCHHSIEEYHYIEKLFEEYEKECQKSLESLEYQNEYNPYICEDESN
jgi:hypothetical protein